MSSESKDPPPGQFLKSLTESIAQLLRWIAELIRQRNWYMLLVLSGVVLAFIAHLSHNRLSDIFKRFFPNLSILLWVIVGLIFVGALVIAVITLPRSQPPKLEDLAERKAIKGLRPFGLEDADIFAQLQRDRLLRDCIEIISNPEFRLGILVGESGCGKTSFLKAGILPQFSKSECKCKGVYVRFSDQRPIAAIQQALADQLEIPMDWLTDTTETHPLLGLFEKAVDAAEKPVVLFLDQFEQWYVHAKQTEDRQLFLQELVAWYKQPQAIQVKILVSIRSDLYFHIVEIQKALQYVPGLHEVFELAKFTPAEATQVLAVIAQTENLRFDKTFVMELAEQELADREDGRISPVDVQILAWMIERQNASELRAFNRQAFQRFGGVEGLLMRFLDQALMARVSEGQRQAALKVLLALTDLERQVRAGVLTVSDLQQTLAGSLSPQEVYEAVRWLERGDVRLITPINRREEEVGYELAHERLIPSLLKQAGRELSEADQANQLLDRRVNEWLGNDRSGHYLFGPQELWLIKKQKPYLTWGSKRPQKEKLLALSWRRAQRIAGVLMALCLGISIFLGWLWYIPEGQIQQVRWALVNPLGGPLDIVTDRDAAAAAIAFAKDGRKKQAIDIITKYVDHPGSQAQFFSQFSSVLIHEDDIQSSKEDLSLVKTKIEAIDNPSYKSYALRAIAAAYGQLKDPKLAHEVLKNALDVAEKIDEPSQKSYALRAIAVAYGQLKDPKLAHEVLKNALTVTGKIDKYYLPDALRAIAVAYGQLKDPKLAHEGLKNALTVTGKIDEPSQRSYALKAIAAAYGQLKDPKLAHEELKNALDVAEKFDNPSHKSDALRAIAAAYGQLKDPKLAHEGLKNALDVAEKFDNPSQKSDALRAIAVAYGQLKDPKLAHEVLKNALDVAEKFDNPSQKSDALRAIAVAYGQLKDPKLAHEVLKNALATTEKIDEPSHKSDALRAIAAAYGQLKDPKLAHEVLKNALATTEKIDEPSHKSNALSAIAAAYGQLKDPKLAHEGLKNALTVTEKFDKPPHKSNALSAIAAAYGQLKDPKFAHEGLGNTLDVVEKFDEPSYKSNALRAITAAYGQLKDPKLAHEGLKNTLIVSEAANAEEILKEVSVKYAYLHNWGQALYALRYCSESGKVKAQTEILTLWAELKNPKLIEGAVILDQPKFSSKDGNYTFTVNLYGPTKGCQQYIDWWEILSDDQKLLDRQTFDKSYKEEQPFLGKSKPIPVSENQLLLIRAHLHFKDKDQSGYEARQAWEGTIKDGFKMIRPPKTFATDLAKADPQPQACQETSRT